LPLESGKFKPGSTDSSQHPDAYRSVRGSTSVDRNRTSLGAKQRRDGAWVAELTGLLDLSGWPKGMRVIVRKERQHPGAQLRFTDIGGHRFTAFATSTRTGHLADLELRHRRQWEPRKMRLRQFSAAGRLVRGSRRLRLRLSARWPWTADVTAAIRRHRALAPG
jgi:hypothetical protein